MVSHCQQGEVPDPQDKALHDLVPAFPAATLSPTLPGICGSPNVQRGVRPLYVHSRFVWITAPFPTFTLKILTPSLLPLYLPRGC